MLYCILSKRRRERERGRRNERLGREYEGAREITWQFEAVAPTCLKRRERTGPDQCLFTSLQSDEPAPTPAVCTSYISSDGFCHLSLSYTLHTLHRRQHHDCTTNPQRVPSPWPSVYLSPSLSLRLLLSILPRTWKILTTCPPTCSPALGRRSTPTLQLRPEPSRQLCALRSTCACPETSKFTCRCGRGAVSGGLERLDH